MMLSRTRFLSLAICAGALLGPGHAFAQSQAASPAAAGDCSSQADQ